MPSGDERMKMPETIARNLLAPCGLDCLLCHHHCDSDEPCMGCRDGKGKSEHCRTCEILACVTAKGLPYCKDCYEFPCEKLRKFHLTYIERFGHGFLQNARLMRAQGEEALIRQQREDWTCPSCGGVVCIHDGLCSECGKPVK